MLGRLRRLVAPAAMLQLVGVLEAVEVARQRRRGTERSLVTSSADRDPASVRWLALTWWPAGAAAVAVATVSRPGMSDKRARSCLIAGAAVTGAGIGLRQWAISTLGPYFVGHVVVQPGQRVVNSGPYRWLRHPSYAGMWLEMTGVGLACGNPASVAACALVPLIGISRRIAGEERELAASLPGYQSYAQGRARLVPFIW